MKETLSDIHFNCTKNINKTFILKFNKIYKFKNNKKKSHGKHYFNRKKSKKLLYALPKKWDTKVDYLVNNAVNLKRIYTIK